MKLILLFISFSVLLFSSSIDLGVEKEVDSFKSKKEIFSYNELLSYLRHSNDKNKIMILGILYANDSEKPDDLGEYIKADPQLVFKYLLKSYNMGNTRALSILGSLILYNDNVALLDPKLDKAKEYLIKSTEEEGDIEASIILANVLLIRKEYDYAIDILKKASEQGDASASMQLAMIYAKGLYSEELEKMVIIKNYDAANFFLNRACSSSKKSDAIKEVCYSKDVETY